MTTQQLIIAISAFFAAQIMSKVIDRHFAKKNNSEDEIEKDIKKSLDEVLVKLNEVSNQLGVTNERTEMLFKMVNKHEAKIDALNEDIKNIYKSKANE